jgi:Zn-dependent M28 family amino/carboxypeptidase
MRRFMLAIAALLAPAALAAQDQVDGPVLMRDLQVLSADDMAGRGTGTEGAERARAYLERRFTELGLQPRRTRFRYDAPPVGQREGVNLWTMIRGTEHPEQAIVVSAHYDHVGVVEGRIHNGADDNASGTAALLAVAAALRRNPPKHTVILAAFDAEELGLFGARMFVQSPPVPLAGILLNINLDMIARKDQSTLWAAGPRIYPSLRPHVTAAAEAAPVRLRLGLDFRPNRPGRGGEDMTLRSDQAAFGMAGIPFIFFTTGDHPDYHRHSDDSERVNAPFYTGVVTTVLDVLRRLDGDHATLETARREGNRPRF